MIEYGGAIDKGGGATGQAPAGYGVSFGAALDQAAASIDGAIHLVVPAAVPSWLVIGLGLLFLAYLVFRR